MDIYTHKTQGFEKPTVWFRLGQVANSLKCANLGQGSPDWQPPQLFLDCLVKHYTDPNANHQYQKYSGNPRLAEVLSKTYSPIFKRELNPNTEILIANGAAAAIYEIITSTIHPGDEVVVIEGFYDIYLPHVQYSGGKLIGIPLNKPKVRDQKEYYNLSSEGNKNLIKDRFTIDFDKLEAAFNEKTKLLCLCSPHNPTGKIISPEEQLKIKKILDKFPKVTVLMDEVYEHMVYDEYEELPRFANVEGMWERTVSVMSAGKTFSATGTRLGWAIGPESIIKKATAIHAQSSFCIHGPLQLALADALEIAAQPYEGFENFYKWMRDDFCKIRNKIAEDLAKKESWNCPIFLPEGGYFMMCDISGEDVKQKYQMIGDEGQTYTKDFNFVLNLAHEKGVCCVPGTPFCTPENKKNGENMIRLAFCKKPETIETALDRL